MKNIIFNFIMYLIIVGGLIFVIGTFEVVRNEYMFQIVEDNVLIDGTTPTHIYNKYLEFKSSNVFNNTYFVIVLNFFGILGLFYLVYDSFLSGWNSRPHNISDVFVKFGIGWILLFSLMIILFNYFKDMFVDKILVVLFNDLVNQIFVFNFFINYFIGLFFICVLIYFFSNQIRHFRTINV